MSADPYRPRQQDQAFRWLDLAFQERDPGLPYASVAQRFAPCEATSAGWRSYPGSVCALKNRALWTRAARLGAGSEPTLRFSAECDGGFDIGGNSVA